MVTMGPPRKTVSAGPAADWADAGIGFAADPMSADNAVAVPTYFRRSRRDPEALRIAGDLALLTIFPLQKSIAEQRQAS
jgi:hypothetical protein